MTTEELYEHICIILEERYCRYINKEAQPRFVKAEFYKVNPANNNHIFWLYENRNPTHYYAISHPNIVAWKNGFPVKISSNFYKPFDSKQK